MSTVPEGYKNRSAKEGEEKCAGQGSSQEMLTSEGNATAQESGQEVLTSEYEDNSKVPGYGQEISRSELEGNVAVSNSDQEILTLEHENESTESKTSQEILSSVHEDISTAPESNQTCLTLANEDNATLSESTKEILSSEHENKSIVLESGQEMLASEKTDRTSEQDCENIPPISISEREILQYFVVEVQRAWKVVNSLTGFKLGIIPPMCLSLGQKVGHWIKLSREVIPFVYVTSTGDSINEVNQFSFYSDNINTKSSTASLLITEYLNRVINQLELEQSDALECVREKLKGLYCLLQSFIKDVVSITLSTTPRNLPQTLAKINELEHSIDQLSLIDRNDLSTPTEKMVTTTESHLLCIIIGVGDTFTQKMIDITDERAMHESPYYIIENFIEDGIYEIVMDSGKKCEGDIKSKLVLLGFSQEKSQQIIEAFSSHSYRTHSIFYFVKEYLENLFSTHPLMTTKMPFLDRYANKPMGKWFDDEVYQRVADEENARKLHFQVIQFNIGDLTSRVINHKFQEYGHTLLFHGAKQANYLESFLREGVKLSCSVNQQDFSNGSGFYLSDDFEAATEWVEKRRHRPNAVVIYRVPNYLLVFGDTAGLDLSWDTELWSSVVKYHRTGFLVEQDVPDRVNLNNRSFIKGPVCLNGMYLRRRIDLSPVPLLRDGRELQQYTIRGEKLAMELSSFVAGVVICY